MKKAKEFIHKYKNWILAVAMLMLTVSFIYTRIDASKQTNIQKVSYDEFLDYLEAGDVDTVNYNKNNKWMTFTLYNDETRKMSIQERDEYTGYTNADRRQVLYPGGDNFRMNLLEYNVILNVTNEDTTVVKVMETIMSVAFPVIWIIVLIVMLKSTVFTDVKPEDIIQTSTKKFDDVIGHDEIIDDLKFITKLMKNPKLGDKIGTQLPKGILFSGPRHCV